MQDSISPLEKELLDKAIEVPGSPFWEVFKRFGRDEAIAMVVNVLGTAGMDYALAEESMDPTRRRAILAVTGPVVEKIGFFPGHFKDAYQVWKETPEDERKPFGHYCKEAVKGGSVSLAEDVLVHDPIYAAMMFAGLNLYPDAPAWMVATTSFVAAVFAVAGLEVGVTELRYGALGKKLKKLGFGREQYMESRFFVSAEKHPQDVLARLVDEFELPDRHVGEYHDVYIPTKFKEYSNRIPKLRLRDRHIEAEGKATRSAQLVYTRVAEIARSQTSQFRFFPQVKDKRYFRLDGQSDMPQRLEDIEDDCVREYLLKHQDEGTVRHVDFERSIAMDREGLFVSTDYVVGERPFYVVELKVRKDKKLLRSAMRYVMREFPAVQVTHGKVDIAAMNGKAAE